MSQTVVDDVVERARAIGHEVSLTDDQVRTTPSGAVTRPAWCCSCDNRRRTNSDATGRQRAMRQHLVQALARAQAGDLVDPMLPRPTGLPLSVTETLQYARSFGHKVAYGRTGRGYGWRCACGTEGSRHFTTTSRTVEAHTHLLSMVTNPAYDNHLEPDALWELLVWLASGASRRMPRGHEAAFEAAFLAGLEAGR